MSKNATTMVTGAPGNDNSIGYVRFYHTVDDGGNWTQLGQSIYGNATDDSFGYSVDITADGTTIICGSPGYFVEDRPGYVQVFKLVVRDSDIGTDTWVQIGQSITGEANGAVFGYSVSISDNGETIAIGAPFNDGMTGDNSGHVRIYHLDDDGMNWEQIGYDIDGDAADDYLGLSVSLSGDGMTVVIGAPYAGDNESLTGGVKVYRNDSAGSSQEQLGQSIYGNNADDQFGYSVDISPDGNTIAVGSFQIDGPGYVRVFSLEGSDNIGAGNWMLIGQDLLGAAIGDVFGYSISLSGDGKTIVIGAPFANGINGDDSGQVRVYRMSDTESEWMQLDEDIYGENYGDLLGWSVSLSWDGNTVAIGTPLNSGYVDGAPAFHVRVFMEE